MKTKKENLANLSDPAAGDWVRILSSPYPLTAGGRLDTFTAAIGKVCQVQRVDTLCTDGLAYGLLDGKGKQGLWWFKRENLERLEREEPSDESGKPLLAILRRDVAAARKKFDSAQWELEQAECALDLALQARPAPKRKGRGRK